MKSKKKFLAIVLAVVMCLSILPMSAFAAEPAYPIMVYVTVVDDNDSSVVYDNNTLFAQKAVYAQDINKDGKITVDEALVRMHKDVYGEDKYNSKYKIDSKGLIQTLCGKEASKSMFCVNNASSPVGAKDTVLKGNDFINFYIIKELDYSDNYTFFDAIEVKAAPKAKINLTLNKVFGWPATTSVLEGAIVKMVNQENGELINITGTPTTDSSGKAEIVLPEAEGTYFISATSNTNTVAPTVTKVVVDKNVKTPIYGCLKNGFVLHDFEPTINVTEAKNNLGNYLYDSIGSDIEFDKVENKIIPLIRDGKNISKETIDKYIKSIEEKYDWKYPHAKMILTLTAMGVDATSVNGKNYLDPLKNIDDITSMPYITTEAFALIALNAGNYWNDIKEAGGTTTADAIVKDLLAKQDSAGGWGFGMGMDIDTTAMMLQALAPYYKTNNDVKAAIDKAIELLSNAQATNGSFIAFGAENGATNAQVVIALSALGIDADTDTRFVKADGSLMDALLRSYIDNSGMSIVPGGMVNEDATNQGYLALVAYNRMKNNQKAVFDMTDITPEAYVKVPATADTTEVALTAITLLSSTVGLAYVLKKKEMTNL